MQRTRLTQEKITFPGDAVQRFSKKKGNDVPIVLIPSDRWICSFMISIPSGVHCVMHRFGKDQHKDRLAEPGLTFKPAYYRIAYCVTQQSNTFNAPVKSCPTSDNVMVDCDLTLVFRIGPMPEDIKNFVYRLGALRFDEFLAAAAQEGIRQLVRQTPHTDVYELRGGASVQEMLTDLNNKFRPFGVTFTECAITDVRFEGGLATTLQNTTEFDSKVKEHIKNHEYELKKINYAAAQDMEELRKSNERIVQDLAAAKQRALIDKEKKEIEAGSSKVVNVTKATEIAEVEETRATSEKSVAKFEGKKKVEDVISKAQAKAEAIRIKADQECATAVYESEKLVIEAKDKNDALKIEAESEGKAAENLRAIREHKLEMAKAEVLEILARQGKIMISGDNGSKLIGNIISSDVLDNFGHIA